MILSVTHSGTKAAFVEGKGTVTVAPSNTCAVQGGYKMPKTHIKQVAGKVLHTSGVNKKDMVHDLSETRTIHRMRKLLSKIKTDMTRFQTDASHMPMNTIKFRTDMTNICADMTKMWTDMAKIRTSRTNIHSDMTNIRTDMIKIQSDMIHIRSNAFKTRQSMSGIHANMGRTQITFQ